MSIELPKTYNPKENESKIYRLWEKSGFFNPDSTKVPSGKPDKRKTYTIVIPPPNITGSLHMGHALNNTLQDILIRWKRLKGFKALWVPGTDHAGIATQNVVEKQLKKEGKTRHDLGRARFIDRVWQWRKEYGDKILDQLKKMGCSCDWSRTAFTMDPGYQEAVKKTFLHYYKKGWIYQGERVINWCPRCQTSLSDLELEYKEEKTYLWHLKYPLVSGKGFIEMATTRPETMLGDTAVAVNPSDARYKKLVGQKVNLPLVNREIPIIADKAIDPEFGTGAVKVTPAHSLIDAEIGQRHKLGFIKTIGEDGKITSAAGRDYEGLNIRQAREKVVADMEKLGLLGKIEDYTHQVPTCYRCDSIVEPLISKQWFVKMDQLAKMAIKAVKNGQIKFHPKRAEKIYFNWLENIKDWCISRQIWWGHKVPIKGETDVLDTWFSSALWPFATLGWPKKTKDLKEFYPTQALSTARDITNLWVARMIFSGLELMKEIPFSDVFIHPTILNKKGQRMSKSLGTGIDPLEMIDQFGADAMRFGLAYQVLHNQDIRFSEENIMMGKKFANKIWNASRFVLQQIGNTKLQILNSKQITNSNFQKGLTAADKQIVKKLSETIKATDDGLANFKFGQVAHDLYDFFWRDFCDTYIEVAKKQEDKQTKEILAHVLVNSLKLLHPYMPFVTEVVYQQLPFKQKKFLMIEDWPQS